ncbi:MAG: hypothetical protein IIA45_07655 [Bacteroidetes bacterium]|nr:hypothetical protein [Bacteroidota bacterium]
MRNPVQRQFVELRKARKIGILYNASNTEDLPAIIEWTKKYKTGNRQISFLGYVDKKKTEGIEKFTSDIHFMNKSDLNWLNIPTKTEAKRFILEDFDLLINMYKKEILPLQYIGALSNAKFRVGIKLDNNLYCNDFLIDLQSGNSLEDFLRELEHYLIQNKVVSDE